MFSHFQESRVLSYMFVTLEDRHPISNYLSSSCAFVLLCHRNIPFVTLGQLSCVPSLHSCTLSAYTQCAMWKALRLCKYSSASTKTLALLKLFQSHTQNIESHKLLWRKLTLSQPKLVLFLMKWKQNSSPIWKLVPKRKITKAKLL